MQTKNFFKNKKGVGMTTAVAIGLLAIINSVPVFAAEGIEMSTAYPGITLKAGDAVNFDLDFLSEISGDAVLSIVSIPEGWEGYFKGGSSQISRVHVNGSAELQEELAEFSLSVPKDVQEGSYEIILEADGASLGTDRLNLEVIVNQEEAGDSDFTSEYPEQQGASGTSFSFDTTIVNNRGTEQTYSLSAQAPTGWEVSFTPAGESTKVASIAVESGSSQGLTVSVIPTETIKEGTYEIPCTAVSASDTLTTTLTVTVTGAYDVTLGTSDGRLSFDTYANTEKPVTLTITNNGNVDLENLNLTSSSPTGWEVSFSESTIELLEAGAAKEITAYVTAGEDAITGDYVTSFTISNEETTDTAEFRVSVKVRTTWGILAAGMIAVLLGILGVVFKKYGRR